MNDKYVFVADFREHTELPERGILSQTLQNDDKTKVIKFCFAPGQELSAHTAPVPAMLYFAKGEATLKLGDDIKEVSEGAFAYMTPLLEHGIQAKTEVVMLLIMVKNAPARQ
jgi:quercetin dioxygenase-like cupin family protein